MASEFNELEMFARNLEKLNPIVKRDIIGKAVKTMAGVYLREAKKLTPKGQQMERQATILGQSVVFKSNTEDMRRSWRIDDSSFKQNRGEASIAVVNTASYASFVNDGHRQRAGRYVPILGKRLVANWVEGLHMTDGARKYVLKNMPILMDQIVNQAIKGG